MSSSSSTPSHTTRNRVLGISAGLLIACLILAICGGLSYSLGMQRAPQSSLTIAGLNADGATETPQFEATKAPTSAPQNPTTAPQSPYNNCVSTEQFVQMVKDTGATKGNPYPLITYLDGVSQKVNANAGTTLVATDEIVWVVWTGSYIPDPTYGGSVEGLILDGQTGLWLQKVNTTVTWRTDAGAICVGADLLKTLVSLANGTELNPKVKQNPNSSPAQNAATSCVDTSVVVNVLNTFKSDPEKIYVELDKIANANFAARLRSEVPTPYKVENTKALFWVRTGSISGAVIELDRSNNKSVYLATDTGTVTLNHAHSGLNLCTDLNPARDLKWWGK